ncbi:unnamed protein product [Lampetra planeri]
MQTEETPGANGPHKGSHPVPHGALPSPTAKEVSAESQFDDLEDSEDEVSETEGEDNVNDVDDVLTIVGGDFNCTLNPALDRNAAEPHPKSARLLADLVRILDL